MVATLALMMAATFGTVLVASVVKLWPYDFSLTLKHFSLDIPGGYDSLADGIKVAIATAFAGTAVVTAGALLSQKWQHPVTRFIDLLATLPAAIPGMVLGSPMSSHSTTRQTRSPFSTAPYPSSSRATYSTITRRAT